MADVHVTLYYDGGKIRIRHGLPELYGMTATAIHEFTTGSDVAVYYLVGLNLSGDQIRQLARHALDELADDESGAT